MKRLLVLPALAVAAAFLPAPAAQANHLCIYSGGYPVWCAPHPVVTIREICVTSGGSPIICVP